MSNILIFTDNIPYNIYGSADNPVYLRFLTQPAGAYAIASNLRSNGYTVTVIDHCSNYTLAGIKKIIDTYSEGLVWVGLSTTFFTFRGSREGLQLYRQSWNDSSDLYFKDGIIDFATGTQIQNFYKTTTELVWSDKELNQIADYCSTVYNIPLLLGGAWVSDIASGNLHNLNSNVHIISGKAEATAVLITKSLIDNPTGPVPLYDDKQKQFDNHEFKYNKFIWTHEDQLNSESWLPLEIARGCAFNCAYCNYDRKSTFDNYKDPKTIYQELVENYEKFGVTRYILMDDLYNDSKEKVRTLYDQVWSRLPFRAEWTSYMRLDMFWSDPDSIKIIQDSGARMGTFGIETLNNIAGRKVGKGLGRDRIIKTLENIKSIWKDEVLVHGLFIVGLPDEPESSIIDTINWTKQTDLLDGYIHAPLWITPPAHQKFVIRTHSITRENEKYGITWISDSNWINREGITFERANELARLGNSNKKSMIGSGGDYPEYRQMGWSHQDVINFGKDPSVFFNKLDSSSAKTKLVIEHRLKSKLGI